MVNHTISSSAQKTIYSATRHLLASRIASLCILLNVLLILIAITNVTPYLICFSRTCQFCKRIGCRELVASSRTSIKYMYQLSPMLVFFKPHSQILYQNIWVKACRRQSFLSVSIFGMYWILLARLFRIWVVLACSFYKLYTSK